MSDEKKPGVVYQVTVPGEPLFQREARLGAFRVVVTELDRDALGNRGVSFCIMDSLKQGTPIRFDMLPDAARVIAALLTDCAEATDLRALIEKPLPSKPEAPS